MLFKGAFGEEGGGSSGRDTVEGTQLQVVAVLALELFENNKINVVVHHSQMPSCHQSVPSVIPWSDKHAYTLPLRWVIGWSLLG